MSVHQRNYDRVQFASLREAVEPSYTAAMDQVEEAYYGTPQFDGTGRFMGRLTDGWRHGVSHPVTVGGQTFDQAATIAGSKQRFDTLHSVIGALMHLALVEANRQRPTDTREDVEALDGRDSDPITGEPLLTRESDRDTLLVNQRKLEGIDLRF